MPRKSSVKKLPKPIQESIHRLLESGRTLDEIVAHLGEMGATVSRSALGRYAQSYEEVAQKLRETRELATFFGSKLEDLPNDVGRTTTEMLHTLLFKVTKKQLDSDDPDIDVRDLMAMARTIKDMSTATKTSADMEIKIRENARKELAEEAKQKMGEAVGGGRLDAEAAEEALRILGFGE